MEIPNQVCISDYVIWLESILVCCFFSLKVPTATTMLGKLCVFLIYANYVCLADQIELFQPVALLIQMPINFHFHRLQRFASSELSVRQ